MKTTILQKYLVAIAGLLLASVSLSAQCETWVDSPTKEEAENAHTIYRQAMKDGDMALAFEHWETAYKLAPAADGRRAYHYTDGAALYKDKLKADEANRAMYLEKIDMLYNQAADCYINGAIAVPKCTGDDCGPNRAGRVLGRYVYDMVYELRTPLSKTYEVAKKSTELAGNTSEYTILDAYSYVAVNLFKSGKIDVDEARRIHAELNEIADYNIENNERFSASYDQAKQSMNNGHWAGIEADIYDCEYFKAKYEPQFRENPDDLENLKVIFATLKKRGCEDSDPLVAEIQKKYEGLAADINAERQAEFEANNPGVAANKLYKAGDFQGAITKYNEAISQETDPQKQASYHFSIASIQFRKLNKYSDARRSARKAMELRPGWGRPEMLIGDMYAKSSNSCGKDAYSRGLVILAALDKWRSAKAKDPEVAAEAQKNINKYSAYIPPKEDIFMRSDISEGQRVNTGCWVGESVVLKGK